MLIRWQKNKAEGSNLNNKQLEIWQHEVLAEKVRKPRHVYPGNKDLGVQEPTYSFSHYSNSLENI